MNVNLSRKYLRVVPKGLDKFPITSLDLSGNAIDKIRHIPESVVFLDLSDNAITEIPEILKSLKNLKILYLYNNLIKEIPDWFGDLKLRNLDLRENPIREIPESFSNLSLTELKIDYHHFPTDEQLRIYDGVHKSYL